MAMLTQRYQNKPFLPLNFKCQWKSAFFETFLSIHLVINLVFLTQSQQNSWPSVLANQILNAFKHFIRAFYFTILMTFYFQRLHLAFTCFKGWDVLLSNVKILNCCCFSSSRCGKMFTLRQKVILWALYTRVFVLILQVVALKSCLESLLKCFFIAVFCQCWTQTDCTSSARSSYPWWRTRIQPYTCFWMGSSECSIFNNRYPQFIWCHFPSTGWPKCKAWGGSAE